MAIIDMITNIQKARARDFVTTLADDWTIPPKASNKSAKWARKMPEQFMTTPEKRGNRDTRDAKGRASARGGRKRDGEITGKPGA
ncbi:hypothetical protein CCP4SC76_5380004 [Gammaproteobacteria bacterium]